MKNKLIIGLLIPAFSFLIVPAAQAESLWGDIKALGKEVVDETKKTGQEAKKEVTRIRVKKMADDTKKESKKVVKGTRDEIRK